MGWLWQRSLQDFWPLDASRVGPNLVASVVQWLIVAGVMALVYPPLRHWAEREIKSLHEKLDRNAMLSHHIIKHSSEIPDLEEEKK